MRRLIRSTVALARAVAPSDVPFDDVDESGASLMKDRRVEIRTGDQSCFWRIEDAAPGRYDDAPCDFGSSDQRPQNTRYNGAGMDVSPALNGRSGFSERNGEEEQVCWRFVEGADVPSGRLLTIVSRGR